MALPINIDQLITGQTVEWERIEFKEGWNDLNIMQTICAFANDFSNLGGGYVIIGVAEKDGRPVLPPKGLDVAEAGKIQSELLSLVKQRIKPEYTPYVEPVTFQGKLILVTWCPGGQERPYEAPDSFVKGAPRYYFIRKFNNTVRPNKSEKEELLRFAAVPFDDRINHRYTINHLSQGLVRSFLQEINSKLLNEFDTTPFIDICRQMNLVEGPNEYLKPKNYALMFFNDHPEKIFPLTRIEVVNFQTPIADKNFTEINFEGPLHIQLKEVLRYLKTQVVKEKVDKLSYQAEAIRYFNFPYEAFEEILANAIYHRSYEINEPIEIRIHPDRIHITSFPGPDSSIKMDDMKTGKVFVRRYRNRQIGNFLKELKLTEGKCTGIPIILKSMRNNGSPDPVFDTDDERGYLAVTLPVHRGFLNVDTKAEKLTSTAYRVLQSCIDGPKSASEIAAMLGISSNSGSLRRTLMSLVESGFLNYTIPGKPRNALQKYMLTSAGEELIKANAK